MKRSGPSFARVKSPIRAPRGLSMGVSTILPWAGIRLASSRPSQSSAPGPVISYLAKPEVSVMPKAARKWDSLRMTQQAQGRRSVRRQTASRDVGHGYVLPSSPSYAAIVRTP